MRYEGGFKTPPRSVETPAFPGTAANGSPPRDAAADADAAADLGTPGRLRAGSYPFERGGRASARAPERVAEEAEPA